MANLFHLFKPRSKDPLTPSQYQQFAILVAGQNTNLPFQQLHTAFSTAASPPMEAGTSFSPNP